MGLIAKHYDLSKVILVVGGIPITGYGDDGGIEVEPLAPMHEVSVGADGLTVASKTNNTDGVATITLSEASLGYAALAGLMQAQDISPVPAQLPLPFLLTDPVNGDVITSAFAIFLNRPTITKGRTAGERVFTLHLPGAFRTASFGVANVV